MRLAPFLVLLAACGGKESPIKSETSALLADQDDVVAMEGDTESIGTALSQQPDAMSAPEPDANRLPTACYARERQLVMFGGIDTYHFRGCGPLRVRGDVIVRWQMRAVVFHVDIESHELDIGTTHLKNASITADVSASGKDRTMIWDAHFDGWVRSDTNPRAFTRDTHKTLRWTLGLPCIDVDGVSTGTIESPKGMRSIRVTMTGVRLCGDVCPVTNSRVRIDNVITSQHIELRMLGPDRALLTDTEGKVFPIRPRCAG